MIKATGLTYRYRRSRPPALLDVSFEVDSASIGVLGPNGAGKSTLFKILTAQASPDSGSFSTDCWNSTNRRGRSAYIRGLSFVPQDVQFNGSYTSLEILRYVAWLKAVPSHDVESRCSEALSMVGLVAQARQSAKTLSGGMKRRLALATALLNDPSILFLDEPTVGLDPFQRSEFRDALTAVMESCTVILSSHLVDDVAALSTEVLVLQEGSLTFCGRLDDFAAVKDRPLTGSDVEAAYLRHTRVSP